MLLLILFAFLAGIVTILSPCILPILPIVLSGSVGGKRKPLGIVFGFILSFTFFTLFLATIVKATGVSAEALRNISIITIFIFGLSLIIPQVQVIIEKLFSKISNLVPISQNTSDGFFSGVFIGLSLGLLWTPCVGPILASVISLALTGSVTSSTFFITLAYSFGTAIPMLAITYGGRQLLQKVPWLLSNSGKIQKAFGAMMVLTSIGIYFNIDRQFQTFVLNQFPQYGTGLTKFEDNQSVQKQLETVRQKQSTLGQVSDFIPGGEWFNSKPLKISELNGKVVLVDFWTYTCINCIRTLPYLKKWNQEYGDKGLVIVGVHTPEFEFEKNPKNVQQAIKDFDIKYPVMQDNNYATWQAYNNRYWPAKYLIDKDGVVRYTHFGEGEYDETERVIQELLQEAGSPIGNTPISNSMYKLEARTPETYLGYQRIENISSPEQIQPNLDSNYTAPPFLPSNTFAFTGRWKVGAEHARSNSGSSLVFKFDAGEVFLVMRPANCHPEQNEGSNNICLSKIKIFLDDKPISKEAAGEDVVEGTVTVNSDRLYKLIKLPNPGNHILKLEFMDNNLEVYAFTFG